MKPVAQMYVYSAVYLIAAAYILISNARVWSSSTNQEEKTRAQLHIVAIVALVVANSMLQKKFRGLLGISL